MKSSTRTFLLSGMLALTFTGHARAADETIRFTMPQLYAEGVAYNPVSNEFLVSSLHYGILGAVGMDGKYREWPRSRGEKFMSSFGIKVDAPRNRVLVCVSDLGYSENSTEASKHKFAGVAIYDLTTGQLRGFVNLARLLPGEHFANDLTVDGAGNIYVTDSFAPVIYKIDARNEASVLFNDPRFSGEGIKLNGIVAHPEGYLLAVRMDSGALFRLDLKSREISEVKLAAPLPGADGLLLDAANDLVLVQNEAGIIRRLRSTDGWRSASLIASSQTPLHFPTTATLANGKVYVLEAKLPELFNADAQKSDDFNIVAAQFVDDPDEIARLAAVVKAAKAKARKHAAKRSSKKHVFKETVKPASADSGYGAPAPDAAQSEGLSKSSLPSDVTAPKAGGSAPSTPFMDVPRIKSSDEQPEAPIIPPPESSPK
ncbi:MAG: gluconolaconase [Alphaproteobacteria bacterium]